MLHKPFYDPKKTYKENFNEGPFGAFSDGNVYKDKGQPKNEIFGHKVYLPFGIGAGPLLNGKFVKAAIEKGFDIVVYKTVRTREYPSNPFPNIVPLPVSVNLTINSMKKGITPTSKYTNPLTITNSFGVPSFDPRFWQDDIKKIIKFLPKGKILIGSFQGTVEANSNQSRYIKDFAKAAKLVKESGCKVLEANLSCPNEGSSHLLCFDISTSTKVITEIKKIIGKTPLIVKITYFEDKKQLENLIQKIGHLIQGVAATNTISTKIIKRDGTQYLSGGPGRLWSGVGGKGIMWAGLEMVTELNNLRNKYHLSYKIFGYGGVSSPKDYQKYKDAGADVVMSVGGSMWNPYLAQEIKSKYL
ncbi:MAG TPA: dihydroorotate oxidase [Patescibacteria group bacterium]